MCSLYYLPHLVGNTYIGWQKYSCIRSQRASMDQAVGKRQFMENASPCLSEIGRILNSKNIWPQGFQRRDFQPVNCFL